MNRRDFLKAFAAAVAAPVVAKVIPNAASNSPLLSGQIGRYEGFTFIESREYGNAVSVLTRGMAMDQMVEKCKEILFADARKKLPPGTPFVIFDGGERDFGAQQGFAWFYSPRQLSADRERRVIARAVA